MQQRAFSLFWGKRETRFRLRGQSTSKVGIRLVVSRFCICGKNLILLQKTYLFATDFRDKLGLISLSIHKLISLWIYFKSIFSALYL